MTNSGTINFNHEAKLPFAIAIAPTVAPNVGVTRLPNPLQMTVRLITSDHLHLRYV